MAYQQMSKQQLLETLVGHMGKRQAIRDRIDKSLETKDYDEEWQGRQEMGDYWREVPLMRSQLIKHYGGDAAGMMTDVHAMQLLNNGNSF
jgi:hypothetical protein